MKTFIAGVLAVVLSGCAIPGAQQKVYSMTESFDEAAVSGMIAKGDGKIDGTAFLRQQGGGVVTCAGNEVRLVPASKYAAQRMVTIYESSFANGEVRLLGVYAPNASAVFSPNPSAYLTLTRSTICDAQGNFEFRDIKDGLYFVVAKVVWQVRSAQGGSLATRVTVKDGKAARVIMSQ